MSVVWKRLRALNLEPAWARKLAQLLDGCVSLGKSLNLSVLPFPFVSVREKYARTCFGVGLNIQGTMDIKGLRQDLAQSDQ